MTPQQQNIAIAEACGWIEIRHDHKLASAITNLSHRGIVGIAPINVTQGLTDPETCSWVIPDYHSDLNACAEFEASFTDRADLGIYRRRLIQVSKRDGNFAEFATPPQRCEAFLKTKGLWQDA